MGGERTQGTSGVKELLRKYYGGLSTGSGWGDLLSDDFLLTGTIAKESRGREPYLSNPFFKMVKAVRVKEMITEGDTAFAVANYDLVSPKGRKMNCDVAEFWKARDGRLSSVAIYFDTAAFNNFLS